MRSRRLPFLSARLVVSALRGTYRHKGGVQIGPRGPRVGRVVGARGRQYLALQLGERVLYGLEAVGEGGAQGVPAAS
jgi:hypothetical protein